MENLPDEIVIKILSYLPTKSVLDFLKGFKVYCYLLKERDVVQFFSLKSMFELNNSDVCQFISTNVAYRYIKVLNIDRLYWIPLEDIRKLISELEILEELYAMDTKLGIRSKDILLYGKLKKLSVSAETHQLGNKNINFYFNCLFGLNKLCLKLNLKENDFGEMYNLFGALTSVQELWIYDNYEEYAINYERIIANLPSLNKFVIKSKRPIPVLDIACWGLIKIFQNKRCDFFVEVTFEKISLLNMKEIVNNIPDSASPLEEAWDIFKSLHCEMPWGPKDFKIFFTGFTMDRIPVEVLLKILSYLNTYDLIQFCEAYNNDYFLNEKHLVRFVDLSRRFELHNVNVCTLITKKISFFFVKILNISYLYWIPVVQLRRLIKQLENLEILLAVDTKLGLRDKDIEDYVNLKKLAISIEDSFEHSTVIASKQLKNLKSLFIKMTQRKKEYTGFHLFFREIKHLEELWICDENESTYRIDYCQLVVTLKQLKKFVIKSKVALPYYDFRCDGLHLTFQCKRSGCASEFIFEKNVSVPEDPERSIFEPKENEFEKSWDVFEKLHKDLPCGPKESKQICLKKDINTVYFEDLNFCHAVILCNSKYVQAAIQVLLSKNSTKLKRLSFRSCLLQDAELDSKRSNKKDEPTQSSFKRPRKGIQINPANHTFQKVVNNIKSLTELEISTCPGCSGETILSAYPLIQDFVNLRKLTLEVPLLMDGAFFKEVFTKCQYLEYLNLICLGQNEKFIFNLCQNLRNARNLRDFRLECKDIVIDKLLSGFNEHRKLLRIFLKCDNLQNINSSLTDSLHSFMENNCQLVFFLLIAIKSTTKQNSLIQKVLNNFKKGNPAKIFFVKNDVSLFTGVFPIPPAHHDMIFNCTNVSVINIDEF